MVSSPGGPLSEAMAADVLRAGALYNETLASLRIASDHLKLIRNYTDPTQETLFRQADRLAVELDQLRAELADLPEPVQPAAVDAVTAQAVPVLRAVVQFKAGVEELIRTCQTLHLFTPEMVAHLRRETEFFLGIVDHVCGRRTPTRASLGLPGAPQRPVPTIARSLIDKVPLPEAVAASLAWTEFWGKHHLEHTGILISFLRPWQDRLVQGALQFQDRFQGLLQEVGARRETAADCGCLSRLMRGTLMLSGDWERFLSSALAAQRTCTLQANFPQRLTEHLLIENDFLAEPMLRLQARQAGRLLSAVPVQGVVYDQLTARTVLVS